MQITRPTHSSSKSFAFLMSCWPLLAQSWHRLEGPPGGQASLWWVGIREQEKGACPQIRKTAQEAGIGKESRRQNELLAGQHVGDSAGGCSLPGGGKVAANPRWPPALGLPEDSTPRAEGFPLSPLGPQTSTMEPQVFSPVGSSSLHLKGPVW